MPERCDGRINVQWQQFLAIELRCIAAKNGGEERVYVPIEPFPYRLSCRWIRTPKAVESFRQVLDDGRGLDMDAYAINQHRNLPPARESKKLGCPMHPLLKLTYRNANGSPDIRSINATL